MTAPLATELHGQAIDLEHDFLAAMRARCAAPVPRVRLLSDVVDQVEQFVERDKHLVEVQGHHLFPTAEDAVKGLQLAEHLRRMADVIVVQVMDEVAESHVIDDHGHSSTRAMFDAATSQSGRDLYGLEQVRKMFRRCNELKTAAVDGAFSWEHLRLLARVYSNQRVRADFVDQQGWFILKADRFDFRQFEILVNRWEEVNDEDGAEPNDAHEKRNATATQDLFTKNWQRRCTHGPLIGSAMADVEQAYIEAEFAKDWEAAKKIHGDKVCKNLLARTDAQRRADAVAQIYADAAANPNKSVPFNIVHTIVWTIAEHTEMARRYAGAKPHKRDADKVGCATIDGRPLDPNEAFIDSLTSGFRRAIINAKGVTIDLSEKRFFTGLSRTALQISHNECEWIGCHIPASQCQADHTLAKSRGGPTEQWNGTILCQRHNRHKERGYVVWRDAITGRLRIKTPSGVEIT